MSHFFSKYSCNGKREGQRLSNRDEMAAPCHSFSSLLLPLFSLFQRLITMDLLFSFLFAISHFHNTIAYSHDVHHDSAVIAGFFMFKN